MDLLTLKQIEDAITEAGAKEVHVQAFFRAWMHNRDFEKGSMRYPKAAYDVMLRLRREMDVAAEIVQEAVGADGSARLVLKMADGQLIESVVLPREGLCVSTQVGCAVGCVFCMTGKGGLIRQLTDFEIAAQLALARRRCKVGKVVFMGMGEPSHNLRNALSALDFMAVYGEIGYKNLVLSTVGDRRLFKELETRAIKPALALSLHTADNEKRRRLLPNSQNIPVEELTAFASKYAKIGRYPVQYQWTLMKGVNDGDDEIEKLREVWKDQFAVLNMIPVNTVEDSPFERPEAERLAKLKEIFTREHILVKFRDSAAQEVDGGCGQLRARYQAENAEA